MLVSHDRYFLDVTVNRILEIWNKRAYFYTGNYDRYLTQKADRRAQLEAAYKNQQDRIEQLEAFINRFRYQATKAKQVQSRIKELDKIERIEIPPEEKTIHFSFPQPPRSGRMVAEFSSVAKSYGEKQVFAGVSFIINRGDRIALVGVNGAGKSTLIKLLAGAETVTAGEFRLGHNVQADYFAQDQYKALDPTARLLDDLTGVAPTALSDQTRLRSLLGCFLFSERRSLQAHRRAFRRRTQPLRAGPHAAVPPNFLLLDEPTNHLDLRAKDVLLEALQQIHRHGRLRLPRPLLHRQLATRVFEIENGAVPRLSRQLRGLPLAERARRSAAAVCADAKPTRSPQPRRPNRQATEPRAASEKSQSNPSPQNEKRREELEEEISRCETEIAIAAKLQLANFKSPEESIRLAKLLDDLRSQLKAMMKEWEKLAVALEKTVAPQDAEHSSA